MSIMFGVRKHEAALIDDEEMLRLAAATKRYAPDGTFVRSGFGVAMGFQPFHTTTRSLSDAQPTEHVNGNALTFDGRLDNHEDLRHLLAIPDPNVSDSALVLHAFLRWGEDSFSRLLGDWALALWVAAERTVYLARDHAGSRTLYFELMGGTLTWSTYLETFLSVGRRFSPDEEYAACYLCSQPVRDLTPYNGIRAVPPACYLVIQGNTVIRRTHWSPATGKELRYRAEREYQEQFLSLFERSVERRAIGGKAILAHLSGGMDSTSIVCMSDHLQRTNGLGNGLVDTLSLYDDSEPHWNERPYFSITEAKRGKAGIHVKVPVVTRTFRAGYGDNARLIFPGVDSASLSFETQINDAIKGRGYRVILSGVGGDELLGGVPTPLPELCGYLSSFALKKLMRQTAAWSIANRMMFWRLLWDTTKYTFHLRYPDAPGEGNTPPWMSRRLRAIVRNREKSVYTDTTPQKFVASRVSNHNSWWSALETLPHLSPETLVRYEYRYPYLDRELVEFLLRVPREQMIRPGRRRYLMRESLRHLVPTEILERRRKGYMVRNQAANCDIARDSIPELLTGSLVASLGFIDSAQCLSAANRMNSSSDPRLWHQLLRTAMLEAWLRAGLSNGTLSDIGATANQ
jgi:asparagine synthase (glutamine-hydrolysing)